MKKINNFLPLIVLLALISLAALAIYNSSSKQEISKNNLLDSSGLEEFSYHLKLSEFVLDGLFEKEEKLSLEDFKNDKRRYSLVNFFASWCTTCLAEHEVLSILKEEKSLNFYGIAWHDYSENAIGFLTKNGNPYHKVALDGKGEFAKMIGIKAIPETLLINSEGVVIMRYQGNIDEATIFKILNFIR